MTAAQAVSRPGAACTVSWSAGPGQAGGEEKAGMLCHPLQPFLLRGLDGEKWSAPSCIRGGGTGAEGRPDCTLTLTSVSSHWLPQNLGTLFLMNTCWLNRTPVPITGPWPVPPPHKLGN